MMCLEVDEELDGALKGGKGRGRETASVLVVSQRNGVFQAFILTARPMTSSKQRR